MKTSSKLIAAAFVSTILLSHPLHMETSAANLNAECRLRNEMGKVSCIDSAGKRIKDTWKTVNGAKYYFNKKGNAITAVKRIKGTYYLFDSRGKLTGTGLVKYKGKTYLVKKGKIRTGIVSYKGAKYYGTKDGLKSGVLISGNKRYCFSKKNYKMVKNKQVDGIFYGKKGFATKYASAESINGLDCTEWYLDNGEKLGGRVEITQTGIAELESKLEPGNMYYSENKQACLFVRVDGKCIVGYKVGAVNSKSTSGWYYCDDFNGYAFPANGSLVTNINGYYNFILADGSLYKGTLVSSDGNIYKTITFDNEGDCFDIAETIIWQK